MCYNIKTLAIIDTQSKIHPPIPQNKTKMKTLFIFNFIIIAFIVLALIGVKRICKSKRAEKLLLIASSLLTIACHYSSLLYHHLWGESAMWYLTDNPNLLLPIYPCNVVMWSCLIYAFLKNTDSRFGRFLGDYIFWFGIVSTLVGMFANVDFIRNPTLSDYDVTKGIVAHATLLFNVLLLPLFGRTTLRFKRNMSHIVISVLMMYAIGLYCNLVFKALVSEEMAYHVNSMFIIHSPFEGLDFLTYPTIAAFAILIYFILFTVCEIIAFPKGRYRQRPCLYRTWW